MRILVRGLVGALCVLAAFLSLGVSVAPAAAVHRYLSQITEVPAGSGAPLPGHLIRPRGLTVDAGELYVADGEGEEYRLDKFNASSGAFVSQFPQASSLSYLHQGVAVGHAAGEAQVYVAGDRLGSAEGTVAVFNSVGNLQAEWNGADTPAKAFGCFQCNGTGDVAVDGSGSLGDWAAGDVYVADPENAVVDVFKPGVAGGEEYVTQLTGVSPTEPFSGPYQVSVSTVNGEVLVTELREGVSRVDIFKPAALPGQYEFSMKLTGTPNGPFTPIVDMATDGSNGDIYVAERDGVDEFSSAGSYLGRITGVATPAGNFRNVGSVAVDPATQKVYVGDGGVVDVFERNLVVPDVTTGAASNVRAGSVTLNGTVNPAKGGEATCVFSWGRTTAFGEVTPCASTVPDGENPVPASAGLTGLQPDTTYHYRLGASNANGTNTGEASQDREFTTAGPGIHEVGSANVASSSVTLLAKIDPNNAPTTYYFQYGTDTGYGTDVPASPGAGIGSGQGDVEVDQHLQGLQVATTYHYRVVADNGVDPQVLGEDHTFTTQPAGKKFTSLDDREWELVSPPAKNGATLQAITNEGGAIQAAEDGGGLAYVASAPTDLGAGGNPAPGLSQILSTRRNGGGWSSRDITTGHVQAVGILPGKPDEYRMFSSDLAHALLAPLGETPLSAATTERTPYLRENSTCDVSPSTCYQPLATATNVPTGVKFGGPPEDQLSALNFEGATPDLRHIVVFSFPALTSETVEKGLYEWTAGQFKLISILPKAEGGTPVVGTLGVSSGVNVRHAISNDGSRVIWSAGLDGTALDMTDLNKEPGNQTVRLDQVQSGAPGGEGTPYYQTASSDGSRIFFTDSAQLTVDSTAVPGIGLSGAPDLYEYDVASEKLTDITVALTPGEHADVLGLVRGASEDGSYLYFVANGVLAQGAEKGGCCNLYVRHDGVTSFVAALSSADIVDFEPQLVRLAARVSPDGQWLTFMSDRSLTGYNNRDITSGEPDEEVFLYNAQTKHLACTSCNPTGARPVGEFDSGPHPLGLLGDRRGNWSGHWLASLIPGWTPATLSSSVYQSRYLSDSGRLFFDSHDALAPEDTNGTWDVYEYEPAGVGGCNPSSVTFSESSYGCLNMMSSGSSGEESAFLDAGANGNDVFFLTAARLASQDHDTALDVYDAHVCSAASPCLAEPANVPPPCSTGDACKAPPSAQPAVFGSPSSATFAGAGNVASAPAGVAVPKSLSRAQRLARAMKGCRRLRSKHKRTACERQATKRYGKRAVTGALKAKKSLSGSKRG